MSILFLTGFGAGTSAIAQATSGTTSISSTVYKTPPYALRVNPATTGTGYWNFGVGGTNGAPTAMGRTTATYFAGWFRYDTAITTLNEICMSARQTGAEKLTVRLTTLGTLALYDNTGTLIGTGTTVLSTATWYFVEFFATKGASAACGLWVNGNLEVSSSIASQGTGNVDYLRLGKVANTNGNSVDFYYDNWYMGDTQGEAYGAIVAELHPTSDSSPAQWTVGTSPSDWSSMTDIPDANTHYIKNSAAGQADTVFLSSLATSGYASPSAIYAAQAFFRCREDTGGTSLTTCATKSGGTVSSLVARDFGTTTATAIQTLETDPNTGSAWTESAINAAEMRVTEANAVAIRCSSMMLEVLLLPSTGITGTLSQTLGALAVSGAGTVDISGTSSQTLGSLSVAATGTVDIIGAASATLGSLTISSSGSVLVDGSANYTLGSLTAAGSGTVAVSGPLSQTLGELSLSATGTISAAPGITGTLAITLGEITSESYVSVVISGASEITLGQMSLSASGQVLAHVSISTIARFKASYNTRHSADCAMERTSMSYSPRRTTCHSFS